MIEYEYKFRVTYPDTDKMGTMHHANYVKYYEAALILQAYGYKNVKVLEGGIMAWPWERER